MSCAALALPFTIASPPTCSTPCPAGKTIRESKFRQQFNGAVVAVARNGERIQANPGDIVVRPGDILLVDTNGNFARQHRQSKYFSIVLELEQSSELVTRLTGSPTSAVVLGRAVLPAACYEAPHVRVLSCEHDPASLSRQHTGGKEAADVLTCADKAALLPA